MFCRQLVWSHGDTIALSDLAPISAAVLRPMLLFAVASMRYQHVDSTKTLKLIADSKEETLKLIEKSETETHKLIEKSETETHKLIEKNRDLIEKNHKELRGTLGDEREQLARIEGYLRILPPPEQGTGDGDGNVKTA